MAIIDTLQVVLEIVSDRATAMLKAFDRQVELSRDSLNKFTKDITVQSQIASAAFLKGMGRIGDWLGEFSPTLQAYFDLFSVQFTDFAETVLSDLQPALDAVSDFLGGLISGFQSLPEPIRKLVSGFLGLTVAISAGLAVWNLIGPLVSGVAGIFGGILGVFGGIAGFITGTLVPALGSVVAALAPFAAPIAIVIAAVLALWLAWETNFGNIRRHLDTFLSGIRGIFDNIIGIIRGFVDLVVGIFTGDWGKVTAALEAIKNNVFGIFQNLWTKVLGSIGGFVVDAAKQLYDGGARLISQLVQGIISNASQVGQALWNAIPAPLRGFIGQAGSAVGGALNQAKGFLGLADGGIVTSPTLALVGERGPEAVIPLSQLGQGGAGNATYNVTINNPIISRDLDVADIARKVAQHLHLEQSASSGAFGWTR